MAYIIMAYALIADIVTGYIVKICTGMTYINTFYIGVGYILMPDIVMAYIVMAYIVMAM